MEHYRKLERMYAAAPINAFYAPTRTVGHRTAEVSFEVQPKMHHSAGAMHGSVYFKALDDAAWFAANSIVSETFVLTHTFTVTLLRPVTGGRIRAVGTVDDVDGWALRGARRATSSATQPSGSCPSSRGPWTSSRVKAVSQRRAMRRSVPGVLSMRMASGKAMGSEVSAMGTDAPPPA